MTLLELIHEVTGVSSFVWGTPSPDFFGRSFYFLEDPDVGRCVLKALRPDFFQSIGEEAISCTNQDLVPEILAYYARLRFLGVAVPNYHEVVVTGDGQPFEIASWLGFSLAMQWGHYPLQLKLGTLEKLAHACKIVGEDPVVGIDMQLANFCMVDGEPVYVDFCPPLLTESSALAFELLDISRDPEVEVAVRYSWYGQFGPLRRLYRIVLRSESRLRRFFLGNLRDFWPEGVDYLEGLFISKVDSIPLADFKAHVGGLTIDDVEEAMDCRALLLPGPGALGEIFRQPLPRRYAILQETVDEMLRFLETSDR